MLEKSYDSVVIGAGAAGMAAALRIAEAGHRVALVEREGYLGGILLQCIHNGFGLHRFKEELTGPEFAERYATQVLASDAIDVYLNTTVLEICAKQIERTTKKQKHIKTIIACSPSEGVFQFKTTSIVLAMGCRERNRGNLGIPGTRPSGIFTAGLAQRLINIDGYLPGKRVVVIGSGDIGLIMARRLTWVGAKVLAVVEILPYPSGITRNLVQCLEDFEIPLYLNHVVTQIKGKDRVEGLEVTPMENGALNPEGAFQLDCDTILLSVGLVPENELSQNAGVRLGPETGGPRVDAHLMTNLDGVFACGNVLHVHDLVDWAANEAERCGEHVIEYLAQQNAAVQQGRIAPGANVKYVVPHRYVPGEDNLFSLRSLIVKERGALVVRNQGVTVKKYPLHHILPAEMIHFTLSAEDTPIPLENDELPLLEVAIE